MNWIAKYAVLAALAVAAGFYGVSPTLAETCQLAKMASFDFSKSHGNRITIPVSINGTTQNFLVGTASALSQVSSGVAETLHLPLHRALGVEFYNADGTVVKRYASIESVGLGPVVAPNVKMLIASMDTGDVGIDGVLAPDLLRNFDLDFDSANKTLNLFSSDHCPDRAVYWSAAYAAIPFKMAEPNDWIEVPVMLDGHNFIAVVNTGTSYTSISAEIARKVFGLDTASPGMERIPGATPDQLQQYHYRFKSLDLQNIRVSNPLVALMPDKAVAAFKRNSNEQKADNDPVYGRTFDYPRVILGMDILSQLHFYIAYGEKTLYVTAAGAGSPAEASVSSSAAAK